MLLLLLLLLLSAQIHLNFHLRGNIFFFKNKYGHTNMAVRKQAILNFPYVNDDICYVDGGPRRGPHWAVIRLLEYGSCT